MDKRNLRKHVRGLKQQYSSHQLSEWSQQLIGQLKAHPWFREATNVMLFANLPDEPDTRPLLLSKEKNLFLPVVIGDDLEIRRYVSDDRMREGEFGIMEPLGEALTDLSILDLVVVPGVAFDKAGHRLGRGRGYYDRLFARPDMHAKRLGYAYPFQIFPAVPSEPHDALMDEVLMI